MDKNVMILGENQYYSLDSYKTKLNNNTLVVAVSGGGKTRNVVTPNLLQCTGSYIVSDPKGNLYSLYADYMRSQGYLVKKLDFTNPYSSAHYNPFAYIRNEIDILKVAHMLVYQHSDKVIKHDPFWDESSQLLIQAIITLLMESDTSKQNIHELIHYVSMCNSKSDISHANTELDLAFNTHELLYPDSEAPALFERFRVAAEKTLRSILITIHARLNVWDSKPLQKMMSYDDVDIASIGKRKTALFVVVSDTDRSMDGLANIFFSQAMQELCRVADKECADYRLPVPVRFILDDFATNVKINEFPRMIASIRSRNISTMLMIQAESQLEEGYAKDAKTIIANCDTYMYLGGNDIETAKAIAERCDVPLQKILTMPIGTAWIFRRGSMPIFTKLFDIERLLREKNLLPVKKNVIKKDTVEVKPASFPVIEREKEENAYE